LREVVRPRARACGGPAPAGARPLLAGHA